MNIKSLLIMLVIGLGVMIGFGNFYTSQLSAYGITPNGTVNTTFNTFNTSIGKLNTQVSGIQNKTAGVLASGISITAVFDVVALFLGVGQLLLEVPTTMGSFINLMIATLSNNAIIVPNWFGTVVTMVIIIIITFQVLKLFTRQYSEI